MNRTTGIRGELTARAAGRPMGPSGRRRPRREGFTLTEIMIALGVLVTGMSMVAAALQAGILNHTTTVDDIIRTIVAENGLAELKARLVHTSSASPTNGLTQVPTIIPDTPATGTSIWQYGVGPLDRRSPYFGGTSTNGTFYGYCAVGWRPTSTCSGTDFKNDYCFSIIPYKIIPADGSNISPSLLKTDYVDSYATATTGMYAPTVTDLLLSDGTTVTNIKYGQPNEKTYFSPGAVVLALPTGSNQVVIGVVDKVAATGGTNVQTKARMVDASGNALPPNIGLVVLLVRNSSGAQDTLAAVSTLNPYVARTALTPYP